MGNIQLSTITEYLTSYNYSAEYPDANSKLSNALLPLSSGEQSKAITMQLCCLIEDFLGRQSSNQLRLAEMFFYLKNATNLRPSRLALIIASTLPDLIRSPSWITRLVKAGEISVTWPSLSDIRNVDKLATLARAPRKYHKDLFTSGRFTNGKAIRNLSRDELSLEIRKLRGQLRPADEVSPGATARKDLQRLTDSFRSVVDQLSVLPEYSAVTFKLRAWERELTQMITETPLLIPRSAHQAIFGAMAS